MSNNGPSRLGSVGKPLPGVEIKISPEGEILVRGPQVSGEYVLSDSAVDDNGWLHTRDAGHMEDGYLYVDGRLDDMIIRGGENISPLEVEDVVRRFPGVRDVAVIGEPDPEWGQRIVAVLEVDELVDLEAVASWTRGLLPSFKCPESFTIVNELPRNDLGKVLRRKLRGRPKMS
jgi:acyl-CoA synthetase (AMP-forming)/AMP-acid ligase II